MSGQPSISKSRKAHPAPPVSNIVSGLLPLFPRVNSTPAVLATELKRMGDSETGGTGGLGRRESLFGPQAASSGIRAGTSSWMGKERRGLAISRRAGGVCVDFL